MVLMRKDVLYECVKRYVKKRKEDPYAFFTPSLRTRKFNFSCCDCHGWHFHRLTYDVFQSKCGTPCSVSNFSPGGCAVNKQSNDPVVLIDFFLR